MFRKKKQKIETPAELKVKVETLVGKHCLITGNINTCTSFKIDGQLKGNIHCDGTLSIGKDANVTGDAKADNVILHGTLVGNIFTKKLELKNTAVIHGNIETEVFNIDKGAIYNGSVKMVDPKTRTDTETEAEAEAEAEFDAESEAESESDPIIEIDAEKILNFANNNIEEVKELENSFSFKIEPTSAKKKSWRNKDKE